MQRAAEVQEDEAHPEKADVEGGDASVCLYAHVHVHIYELMRLSLCLRVLFIHMFLWQANLENTDVYIYVLMQTLGVQGLISQDNLVSYRSAGMCLCVLSCCVRVYVW